ncbi:hypothetical protein [Saccharopolyspora hattusasensis]|uniref:hypothetical protein n=1 Tax=Saccharopolyspora hattusasensis TaxID=1128679 RepID=UPI003D964300
MPNTEAAQNFCANKMRQSFMSDHFSNLRIVNAPEFRFYGSKFTATAHMSKRQLAETILRDLTAAADWHVGVALHTGGCFEIWIANAVTRDASDEELDAVSGLVCDYLYQFGWINPRDPKDKRFDVCSFWLITEDAGVDGPVFGSGIPLMPCPKQNS